MHDICVLLCTSFRHTFCQERLGQLVWQKAVHDKTGQQGPGGAGQPIHEKELPWAQ